MKWIPSFVLVCLLFIIKEVNALNCSVDVAQFMSGDQAYVDIYLRVEGRTCNFVERGTRIQGAVIVTMTLSNGDEIVGVEKYRLNSGLQIEIIDMLDKRRFFVDPETYDLVIKVEDVNQEENVFEYKSKLVVHANLPLSNALVLSKVEASDQTSNPLVRNGLYMEVQPYMIIPDGQNNMSIYQEVYLNKFVPALLIHKIALIPYNKELETLTKFKKIKREEDVFPLLTTFDISQLTSGKYKLKTSIVDITKQELAYDELDIIVQNTLGYLAKTDDKLLANSFVNELDSAGVTYALMAIVPITNYKMMSTIDYVIEKGSESMKRRYLHMHWNDAYPGYAKQAFDKYMEIVEVVDKDYNSSVGRGFQTDRGYIYLKYGKPSKFINIIDEPNTPPYEIWYYNYLEETNQTNVRFIFYDPLQVNNYQLLHSTCYGERENPAWETVLYKFNQDERIGHTIIATEVGENWGRRAKKLFNDF